MGPEDGGSESAQKVLDLISKGKNLTLLDVMNKNVTLL